MKITFYSNFLTHHQIPFCLEMKEKYGNEFTFVSTFEITEERLKLGYKNLDNDYDFVLKAYESEESYKKSLKLSLESDIVIIGSTSDAYVQERLKRDMVTFRYRERIFFKGFRTIFDFNKLKEIYEKHIKFSKNKNLYILCASAYGAGDFNKIGCYKSKTFKWGYFPDTRSYDVDELLKSKSKNKRIINILWTGRLIKCKHPEYMIKIAKKLKKDNYEFNIKLLGNGELYYKLDKLIKKENLSKYVQLVGAVDSDKVRDYMEKADIFLFTSDKREGWGAVLNESMNSACAVVANRKIGAVPFMMEHDKNGLIYDSFNQLYEYTKRLVNNKQLRDRLGKEAYKTIKETWNSKNATNNLNILFDCVLKGKEDTIKQGPASKAYRIN